MQQRERILRDALAANLEVHMAGGGASGAPDGADRCSGLHRISCLDEVGTVMGVDGAEPVRVSDLDCPSIGGLPSAERDGARSRGADGRTRRRLDVHPAMPSRETAAAEA